MSMNGNDPSGGNGGNTAAGGTDTAVRPSTGSTNGSGDHDKFKHYVIGGTEAVTRAMVTGEPCTALCGKVWVPGSNGSGFQMCPTCDEMAKGVNPSRFQNW